MPKIDETIRKLIKTSLFLDKLKKNKLEKLLLNATKEKKKTLLKILKSENEVLKKNIIEFLENGGSEGDLERLYFDQKKIVLNASEEQGMKEEQIQMDKLLSDLNA